MLELMRKKAGSWMMKFVLFGIAIVFAFWGVGGYSGQNTNTILTIDKLKVPYSEYRDIYNTLLESFRLTYGNQLNSEVIDALDIKGQAVETLLERYLLLKGAQDLSVTATDQEVATTIATNPSFSQDGIFSPQRYQVFLDYNRMTHEAYELSVAKDITITKMMDLIRLAAVVTPQEVNDNLHLLTRRISVRVLTLDANAFFRQLPQASDEELLDYYDEHLEDYRIPEKYTQAVVVVDPTDYRDEVEVSEEEIEENYWDREEEFTLDAAYKIQNLLFAFPAEASVESISEVREKAGSAADQIRDGEITFSDAVNKWSGGKDSVLLTSELPFIEESNLDPAIASAIGSLEKGEVSDPVATSKGFEVLILVESRPERLQPLEEVRNEIESQIREGKSSEYAFDLADDVLAQAEASETSLRDAALAKDLKVILTKPFSRGQVPQNQGVPVEIFGRAFGTEEEDLGDIYEDGGRLYLFQTFERAESYLPEFDVVKDEVTGGFLVMKALQKAEDTGEELLEQLKVGRSLRSLAGEIGLEVTTTPFFTVVDTTLPGLMEPIKLIRKAFTLKGAGASSLVRGDRVHYIIVFNEEQPADEETAADQRKSIEVAVRFQKEQDVFLDYIATMKSELADKIVINKDII